MRVDAAPSPDEPDEPVTDQHVLARVLDGDTCTLDELADLANGLLAGTTTTDRRASDRVDGRTVRYYTTHGLLPRPSVGSDRRARYGRDHLVRLLAVRRLQAGGVALADAYRHLTGADTDTVERLAQLPVRTDRAGGEDAPAPVAAPAAVPTVAAPTVTAPTAAVRPFWATPPAAAPGTPVAGPVAGSVVVLAPGLRLVSDLPLDVPTTQVLAAAAPLLALLTPKEHSR